MARKFRTPRRRPTLLGGLVHLEDRTAPAVALALSNNALVRFDTDNPAAALAPVPITGLVAGENLVGIDFRPQTGTLYGLATDGAGGVRLYAVSQRTGIATPLTAAAQQFDDGTNPVPIDGANFGFDFNPTVDRIRVVSDKGFNFRMNPNNGKLVDGDGVAPGVNPDGALNLGSTSADGSGYTNSFPNTSATTLYAIDAATDSLYLQNPPNAGTLTTPVVITLDGKTLDFTAVNGFDIPSTVKVAASNTAATGQSFAVLNDGTTTQLYGIELSTGVATALGDLKGIPVQGFAVQNDLGGTPIIGLGAIGTIDRSNTATPGTVTSVAITGLTVGELLVGIDIRPTTGQLVGVGIDAVANTGTLYVIDPQTGAAAPIGTASKIAFVDGAANPVDLPDPITAGYGVDFNPTVDRVRVVTSTGLNFRANPVDGTPVDGDLGGAAGSVTGVNTDGNINGSGSTGVSATAYTNNFPQDPTAKATTQYTIDATQDTLFIQNPPNAGTQTTPVTITLGGSTLDFFDVNGFDIAPGVSVAASNGVAAGNGLAVLTVGGTSNLYTIDLTTGEAKLLGATGTLLGGLTAADTPAGSVAFTAGPFTVSEDGGKATVTLTRTGGSSGPVAVTLAVTGGSAKAGDDFTAPPATVVIADGQTTATVDILITDDTTFEDAETIELTISAPTNTAALGKLTTATVTITDNDVAPGVSIADVTLDEGDTGTTAFNFTVTLAEVSGKDTKVVVNTVAGTATDGTDFTGQTGLLVTIPAGKLSQDVTVVVNGDTDFEPDETFFVTLSNAMNAVVTDGVALGIITNDDASPQTPPVISDIADQSTTPGTATTPVTFFVGDNETPASQLVVTAVSDNQTLVPDAGIVITGTGPNRSIMVAPADGQTGTAMITVTVTDGNGDTATDSFVLTVGDAPANTPPVISDIPDRKATSGVASVASFVIADAETPGSELTVTAATSDDTLIPAGQIMIGGTGNARTVTFTPAVGQTGTATITITVTDAAGDTATDSFVVTVGSTTLTPPTISNIPNQTTTPGRRVGPVAFQIGDAETPLDQLTITVASSNPSLVPVGNVAIGGSGAMRSVIVSPVAGMTGTATITLTVTDSDGQTASDAFTVTVAVAGAPTILAIPNQTTPQATPVAVNFTVGDGETPVAQLTVTATSDNATLVPAGGITVGGTDANRSVTITPAAGQTGTATITVTVTDGDGQTAIESFTLTVTALTPGTPVLVGFPQFGVGADVGSGVVTYFNADKSVRFSVSPFGGTYFGGVRTAAADFNGDGVADLVVGTGTGIATFVRVLDGVTQAELFSVAPFESTFTGGVFVAAGDINGDGKADLVISPDQGGGPRVDIYSGNGFGKLASFFGIADPNFRGGARSAVGDVNGDGVGDVVVAAGFQGGPRIATFDGKSLGGGQTPRVLFNDFFAFEDTLRNGTFVAAGDVNGDGFADIVAGGGPGGGPRVTVFSGKDLVLSGGATLNPLANFFGGDPNNRGGIRVAVKNLDADTQADLVVGSGEGAGSRVTSYLGKNIAASGTPAAQFDFDAFPGFTGGVFVG